MTVLWNRSLPVLSELAIASNVMLIGSTPASDNNNSTTTIIIIISSMLPSEVADPSQIASTRVPLCSCAQIRG